MAYFFSFDGVDGVGKSTQIDLFCDWLNENYSEHGLFRLPTWNEWMIAAYGDLRRYPWGDEWDQRVVHNAYGHDDAIFYFDNESVLIRRPPSPSSTEPVKNRPGGRTPRSIMAPGVCWST